MKTSSIKREAPRPSLSSNSPFFAPQQGDRRPFFGHALQQVGGKPQAGPAAATTGTIQRQGSSSGPANRNASSRCLNELNGGERANIDAMIALLGRSIPLINRRIRSGRFRIGSRRLTRTQSRLIHRKLRELVRLIRGLLRYVRSHEERICFGDVQILCHSDHAGACFSRVENKIFLPGYLIGRQMEPENLITEAVTLVHEFAHERQEASLRRNLLRTGHGVEGADDSRAREREAWTYGALLFEILVPRGRPLTAENGGWTAAEARANRVLGGERRSRPERYRVYFEAESSTLDHAVDNVFDPGSDSAGRFRELIDNKYPSRIERPRRLIRIVRGRMLLVPGARGGRAIDLGVFDAQQGLQQVWSTIRWRFRMLESGSMMVYVERGGRMLGAALVWYGTRLRERPVGPVGRH